MRVKLPMRCREKSRRSCGVQERKDEGLQLNPDCDAQKAAMLHSELLATFLLYFPWICRILFNTRNGTEHLFRLIHPRQMRVEIRTKQKQYIPAQQQVGLSFCPSGKLHDPRKRISESNVMCNADIKKSIIIEHPFIVHRFVMNKVGKWFRSKEPTTLSALA